MTSAQLRSEIDRLASALFKSKLAIDSNVHVLAQSKGGVIVSWSNDVQMSDLFENGSTLQEYVALIQRRWFSVLLIDGAILQISYTLAGDEIQKHRLCYYPCPIRFELRELEDFTIQQLVGVLNASEFRERLRLEGPLRFDYDIHATKPDHPASHLTFSRATCRIPVSAPLSVGHFVRFLFSHFYPEYWKDSEALRTWACSTGDACLPELENDRLFIQWKQKG